MKVYIKSFNIYKTNIVVHPCIQIHTIFLCKECDKSWLHEEEIQLSYSEKFQMKPVKTTRKSVDITRWKNESS